MDSVRRLLHQILSGQGLKADLLRGGIGSFVMKATSTLLGFLVVVTLSRLLGPSNYGLYVFVFALVSLLAIPAEFGLANLVVRETASAQARGQWGTLRGLWRWANSTTIVISSLLILVGVTICWSMRGRFPDEELSTFGWGLALVPLIALGKLRGAALRGLNKVVQAQLPEQLVRPALLILGVLTVAVWQSAVELTPTRAMQLHAIAALIASLLGTWRLHRERPAAVATAKALYEMRKWTISVVPLAFSAGLQLINRYADILMLGLFSSAQEVGIYRVGAQTAALVAFGLLAVNGVVAPQFARLYTEGDMERLQRLVTISARVIVLFALPVVVLFVFMGESLLRAIFGSEYGQGHLVLMVLASAQLVNAAMGSVAILLNMTGHERETARWLAVSAILNVVLNLVLIPILGKEGAALATACSIISWNVLLWRAVRIKLGIDSFAIALAPRVSR